jgi:hypothetical protein
LSEDPAVDRRAVGLRDAPLFGSRIDLIHKFVDDDGGESIHIA